MILLILILLILLAYLIFYVSQFYNILFRGYAPFVSTNTEAFKKIINEVEISNDFTIYELGCGRARFLRIVEEMFCQNVFEKHFRLDLIGVENLSSIYLLTKFGRKFQGSAIKLINGDFFSLDLKNADLIYCYLNNETMKNLGEKFIRECKKGTQIISRRFPIPQFIPEKVIEIKNMKVYFYRI